jgi:hypothetical protein
VPVSVTWRGEAVRLTTTRSALVRSAQSVPPAGVPAAAGGALDELALAEAGYPELPAETLPHAASPTRAMPAIRPCTPRAAMAALLSSSLGRSVTGHGSVRTARCFTPAVR